MCSLLARSFVCECHTISAVPRFQPPPRRTQHADFPHCALLFASPQGLWDLSCRSGFRRGSNHSVAIEQLQSLVQPSPTPPRPVEALSVSSKRLVRILRPIVEAAPVRWHLARPNISDGLQHTLGALSARMAEVGEGEQGEERDPPGQGLWRAQAQFCGTALLGPRIPRQHGRARRGGHPGLHSQPREGGSEARTAKPLALTMATFRWLQAQGAASATPPTALSGSHPKAPGFAGRYLHKVFEGAPTLARTSTVSRASASASARPCSAAASRNATRSAKGRAPCQSAVTGWGRQPGRSVAHGRDRARARPHRDRPSSASNTRL